jgi:Tfp pilus assembly protein PilN
MIKINLISSENIQKVERNEVVVLLSLVMAIVLAGAGVRYVSLYSNNRKLESRITAIEQELGKYQNIVRQVDELQKTKGVLETKRNVIKSLMASRLIYPRFMEEIVTLMPVNIWFRTLGTQLQKDGRLDIVLDAESLDNYSIADFIASLTRNQDFSGVELGPINTVTNNKVTSSSFRLNFAHQKKNK